METVKVIIPYIVLWLLCFVLVKAQQEGTKKSIPLLALSNNYNTRTSFEKLNRAYEINNDNNLINHQAKLRKLQSHRRDSKDEEPIHQFIIKVKDNASDQAKQALLHFFNSGLVLGSSDTYVIVSKTSDILKHIGEGGGVEFLAHYEPRLKSSINFDLIQKKSKAMVESKRSLNQNAQLPNIEVQITIVPSVYAYKIGNLLEEITSISHLVNLQFGELFDVKDYTPLRVSSSNMLEMSFSPLIAGNAFDVLSNHPNVHFIALSPIFSLQNKVASSSMQATGPQSNNMNENLFYSMGIYGNNQIVAVSDTGINWSNCLFSDSTLPIIQTDVSLVHRKIVRYVVYLR